MYFLDKTSYYFSSRTSPCPTFRDSLEALDSRIVHFLLFVFVYVCCFVFWRSAFYTPGQHTVQAWKQDSEYVKGHGLLLNKSGSDNREATSAEVTLWKTHFREEYNESQGPGQWFSKTSAWKVSVYLQKCVCPSRKTLSSIYWSTSLFVGLCSFPLSFICSEWLYLDREKHLSVTQRFEPQLCSWLASLLWLQNLVFFLPMSYWIHWIFIWYFVKC